MPPIELLVILLYYRPSLGLSDSIEPKQVYVAEGNLLKLHVVCRPLYPSFFRCVMSASWHFGYDEKDARKKIGVVVVVVELWVVACGLC